MQCPSEIDVALFIIVYRSLLTDTLLTPSDYLVGGPTTFPSLNTQCIFTGVSVECFFFLLEGAAESLGCAGASEDLSS